MVARDIAELSKADLCRVLEAVRALAAASAGTDVDGLIAAALRIAIDVTESDGAVIYRLDEPTATLVWIRAEPHDSRLESAFGRMPVDDTWTGRHLVRLEGSSRPVSQLSPEAQKIMREVGLCHVATLPLHVRGRPTGSLNLSRRTDRPYTERDLRVGEVLADLLVVYLENARLLAEASSRLDETRMLLEVARTVTDSLSLETRLQASAEILARMIDASNAFILLLDETGTVLRGVTCADVQSREYVRSMELPVNASSLAAEAVKTRKTIVVDDAAASPLVRKELVEHFGQKSLLALPLLAHNEPIGAVIIGDTRRIRVWTASEIERAELISVQVANAVANARLFEEVKHSYERLAHAQAELLQRERLAAVGQLSATLAHEVRNPLGVLFNSVGTLTKMIPEKGDATTLLAIMGEELRRLDRLVRELLDFARPLIPSLEVCSLAEVVDDAMGAAAQQLDTECAALSSLVPSDFPKMSLDTAMMRRAVVNLLVNGSQAAGRGGTVVVRATVETRGARELARIEVADSGSAIAPDIAKRVFDPFFTTKATGTGLGHAIVKGIVEAHAGEIALASERGDGTRVTLLLPLEAPARSGW